MKYAMMIIEVFMAVMCFINIVSLSTEYGKEGNISSIQGAAGWFCCCLWVIISMISN